MPSPPRGPADYFAKGDWNAQCSMCGRKRKASTLVQNWQGLWRCPVHNEPRQPQDFVRAVADTQTPAFSQLATYTFRGVCDPNSISCYSDYATCDCVMCDYISPAFNPDIAPGE